MLATLVMTVIGADRPGLVQMVAARVADHGGNWLESRMCRLGGQFAGILRVEVATERRDELVNALRTLEVDGLPLGLSICYDLRFANQFWTLAPQTDCFVVIANWPESRRAHWRALLVARAVENQAYVVGVNRVGSDPVGNTYAGDSQLVDPRGRVLVEAAYQEIMLSAEVDPEEVRKYRQEFPALADRRDIAPSRLA